MNFIKLVYIILGTISLSLGSLGIVVPGLPTTPFVLLSAALYLKSSDRLYNWLLNHKLFGKILNNFRSGKSWTIKSKIFSIILMLIMISVSVIFFIKNYYVKIIVIIAGLTGFIFMMLIPVYKNNNQAKSSSDTGS